MGKRGDKVSEREREEEKKGVVPVTEELKGSLVSQLLNQGGKHLKEGLLRESLDAWDDLNTRKRNELLRFGPRACACDDALRNSLLRACVCVALRRNLSEDAIVSISCTCRDMR